MLPALFAFSTNSLVETLGSTFVSSDSSPLSSESGSGGSSPSLASVEKIVFYRIHSQRIICNIWNTRLNLVYHYLLVCDKLYKTRVLRESFYSITYYMDK